jgi:hypothetical protein
MNNKKKLYYHAKQNKCSATDLTELRNEYLDMSKTKENKNMCIPVKRLKY